MYIYVSHNSCNNHHTCTHTLSSEGCKNMPLDDVVALYTSLVDIALRCYLAQIDYVDKAQECTLEVFQKR